MQLVRQGFYKQSDAPTNQPTQRVLSPCETLSLFVDQLQLATRDISRSMTTAPTVAATIVNPKTHG
jgi:hypothetical protein